METRKRELNPAEPIIWTGDLNDDCVAEWCGLMLRAEQMDEEFWWWAVYEMQKGNAEVDASSNTLSKFTSGEAARKRAESVARQYIQTISGEIAGKFLIKNSFKITGRGLVLGGDIINGPITSGCTIEILTDYYLYHRKIVGVEISLKNPAPKITAGLLIGCKNEYEIDELKKENLAGQIATVFV